MRIRNIKGASWDSMFLVVVRVISTLASIIEIKILSVGFDLTDYGTYSQIGVIVSICNSMLLLGMGDALNYYYNNRSVKYDRNKRLTIVNTIFAIEIIAGIIVAIGLFAGRGLLATYYSNPAIGAVK